MNYSFINSQLVDPRHQQEHADHDEGSFNPDTRQQPEHAEHDEQASGQEPRQQHPATDQNERPTLQRENKQQGSGTDRELNSNSNQWQQQQQQDATVGTSSDQTDGHAVGAYKTAKVTQEFPEQMRHDNREVDVKASSKASGKRTHTCLKEECGEEFASAKDLNIHMRSAKHRAVAMICPWCTVKRTSPLKMTDFKRHVKKKHKEVDEPDEFFSVETGFYFAQNHSDYLKVIKQPAPFESKNAHKAREYMKLWFAKQLNPQRSLQDLEDGWNLAKSKSQTQSLPSANSQASGVSNTSDKMKNCGAIESTPDLTGTINVTHGLKEEVNDVPNQSIFNKACRTPVLSIDTTTMRDLTPEVKKKYAATKRTPVSSGKRKLTYDVKEDPQRNVSCKKPHLENGKQERDAEDGEYGGQSSEKPLQFQVSNVGMSAPPITGLDKKNLKCTMCNRVNCDEARFCDWCGAKRQQYQPSKFQLSEYGEVKDGRSIYKLVKDMLDDWFKDKHREVYIFSPFIDTKRLADICKIYFDNRKTATLGGVYIRNMWSGNAYKNTNEPTSVKDLKRKCLTFLKNEHDTNIDIKFIEENIYPKVFAISSKSKRFHTKLVANVNVLKDEAEVLFTSANLTGDHFDCDNLDHVVFQTMPTKHFMDRILGQIWNQYDCVRCKTSFTTETQLTSHLRSQYDAGKLVCLWCSQKRRDVEQMKKHCEKKHGDNIEHLNKEEFFSIPNAFYYACEPDVYVQFNGLKELPPSDSESAKEAKNLRLQNLHISHERDAVEFKWKEGRYWILSKDSMRTAHTTYGKINEKKNTHRQVRATPVPEERHIDQHAAKQETHRQESNTATSEPRISQNSYHRNIPLKKHTLLIGDSMLRDVQERGLEDNVRVKSLRGKKIANVITELSSLDLKDYNKIVIYAGGNDDAVRHDVRSLTHELRQMITYLEAQKCDVFLCTIAPRKDADVVPYNDVIMQLCKVTSATLIQTYSSFVNGDGRAASYFLNKDGIFTNKGTSRLLSIIDRSVRIIKKRVQRHDSRPLVPANERFNDRRRYVYKDCRRR